MTITQRRRSKNMSLGELARACDVSIPDMSKVERGKNQPTESMADAISRALDCSRDEVMAGLPGPTDDLDLDMFIALAAVQAEAKAKGLGRGHGGQGFINCPICKGQLGYSVASVNGHIWGKCKTDGCVSWMM